MHCKQTDKTLPLFLFVPLDLMTQEIQECPATVERENKMVKTKRPVKGVSMNTFVLTGSDGWTIILTHYR
jgi:hypothetical protein